MPWSHGKNQPPKRTSGSRAPSQQLTSLGQKSAPPLEDAQATSSQVSQRRIQIPQPRRGPRPTLLRLRAMRRSGKTKSKLGTTELPEMSPRRQGPCVGGLAESRYAAKPPAAPPKKEPLPSSTRFQPTANAKPAIQHTEDFTRIPGTGRRSPDRELAAQVLVSLERPPKG